MAEPLTKPHSSLHDRDFFAWTQDQASRLRARAAFDNRGDIDWENAAEEIESLGRSERREIENRLAVVLLHLLKWRYQPAHRSSGWKGSIVEQRRQLQRRLRDNPSLAHWPRESLEEQYALARLRAVSETGLEAAFFPEESPFVIEDVLDQSFYPDGG